MTRAQRIALARHEVFADWLFMRQIARKPMHAGFDNLLKRFYAPAMIEELRFLKESPLQRAFSDGGFEGKTWAFDMDLSVRR